MMWVFIGMLCIIGFLFVLLFRKDLRRENVAYILEDADRLWMHEQERREPLLEKSIPIMRDTGKIPMQIGTAWLYSDGKIMCTLSDSYTAKNGYNIVQFVAVSQENS